MMKHYEQTTTPIPCLSLVGGEGGRRVRNAVETGQKGEWRRSVFSFVFISRYPTLFNWQKIKCISHVESVLPVSNLHELLCCIFSPCPIRRGSERVAG